MIMKYIIYLNVYNCIVNFNNELVIEIEIVVNDKIVQYM